MNIVRLEKEHITECTRIYIETFNGEPWNDRWTEATAGKRLDDIYNAPGFIGMVAIADDSIKGAVFGNIESWYEGSMYNLKEMFVTKGEKGTGIGSKLFESLEQELKDQGVTSLTLFTSKGDLTEKFYQKNGCMTEEDMVMMGKEV